MRVETLGDGEPELAVISAVHGDEPAGVRAIERLLDDDPDVDRPIKLVVANERALEAGVRFVDVDLNRVYPGDPDADSHERRLAARLHDVIDGCRVIDLHETVSEPTPFVALSRPIGASADLAAAAGVGHAVDISLVDGGVITEHRGVAIECGPKGTAASIRKADRVLDRILRGVDVLPGDPDRSDPTLFQVTGRVGGAGYEFVGENFRRVDEGTAFAVRDEDELVAEEPFYPTLMSTDGYETMLGFRSELCGTLSERADQGSPADD